MLAASVYILSLYIPGQREGQWWAIPAAAGLVGAIAGLLWGRIRSADDPVTLAPVLGGVIAVGVMLMFVSLDSEIVYFVCLSAGVGVFSMLLTQAVRALVGR